jgi:hypothetical protein
MTDFDGDDSEKSALSRYRLLRQAPYIIALLLAIGGAAFSIVVRGPITFYWEFLAVAMCVICIVTEWPNAQDSRQRFRLIGGQVLHWAGALVAMNLMVLFHVQTLLPPQSASIVLLDLLALATFLAGVSFLSPSILFLGAAMAATVPAIAWLTQSLLFILLIVLVIFGIVIALWPVRKKAPAAGS